MFGMCRLLSFLLEIVEQTNDVIYELYVALVLVLSNMHEHTCCTFHFLDRMFSTGEITSTNMPENLHPEKRQ